jgi:hypothetical protein
MPNPFPLRESAVGGAIHAGKQKMDLGHEPRSVLVNGSMPRQARMRPTHLSKWKNDGRLPKAAIVLIIVSVDPSLRPGSSVKNSAASLPLPLTA